MDEHTRLERSAIRLVPHQPQWKEDYEQEKGRILSAIGKHILNVQHIGSTAIPGIVAKPIIDIGVAVTSFEEAIVCVVPLEAIGYAYWGENGIPRRHYFDYGSPCTVHLHMFEQGSPEWAAHLLFRDYLVRHPQTAAQYADLKLKLAEQYRAEREKYTNAKGPFIREVIALAREEQRKADGNH